MAQSIGDVIDLMHKQREKIREAEAKANELKEAYREQEEVLEQLMKDANLEKASGKLATAARRSSVVPQVRDWDKFYAFIHRTKSYHLLERRAAAAPYRELLTERKGKDIPGVEPFTKYSISLTTKP